MKNADDTPKSSRDTRKQTTHRNADDTAENAWTTSVVFEQVSELLINSKPPKSFLKVDIVKAIHLVKLPRKPTNYQLN